MLAYGTFKPPQFQEKEPQHRQRPDSMIFSSNINNDISAGATKNVAGPATGADKNPIGGKAQQMAEINMFLPDIVGMPWQWLNSTDDAYDEETALADAIIHGTKVKKVPRVRTAVDSLIEAIEDEKVKQLAKHQRQYEALRTRLQSQRDERMAQKPTIPPYFIELARQGAEYWRQKKSAGKQNLKIQSQGRSEVADKYAKLAKRRQQKDKLMLWKENQTYQLPEDHPDVEQLLSDIFRENQDLELGLFRDMETEDDFWGPEPFDERSKEVAESKKQPYTEGSG